jgi:hypothetical protein
LVLVNKNSSQFATTIPEGFGENGVAGLSGGYYDFGQKSVVTGSRCLQIDVVGGQKADNTCRRDVNVVTVVGRKTISGSWQLGDIIR